MTTDDSAAWNLELTRAGQVRFPILRRRSAVRLGLFAIWLQTEVVTVVPFESRRRRQIVIMSEYADKVDVLGKWLADLQRRQRHAIGE